jgi:hypothetical protein
MRDVRPLSFVFATHTKTTGVYTNNSHLKLKALHSLPNSPNESPVTSHQSLADRIWAAAIPGAPNV